MAGSVFESVRFIERLRFGCYYLHKFNGHSTTHCDRVNALLKASEKH